MCLPLMSSFESRLTRLWIPGARRCGQPSKQRQPSSISAKNIKSLVMSTFIENSRAGFKDSRLLELRLDGTIVS